MNSTQTATLTISADGSQWTWQAPYCSYLISDYKWLGGRWNPDVRAWVFTNPERGTRGRLLKLINKQFPDWVEVHEPATIAQPEPAPAVMTPGMARCEHCGDEVAEVLLMTSSTHGNVCPSCYDRVER